MATFVYYKTHSIMKKHLLIVALCCLGAIASKAQMDTIYNSGFETWSSDALAPSAMDPNGGNGKTGWWDFNLFNNSTFFGTGNPISVYRNADTVHSGKYSALVESVVFNGSTYTTLKSYGITFPDTMGLLITGNINASLSGATVKLGEPFQRHITAYTFFYQYYPHLVDTASCSVVLSHFSGGKRNIVGAGLLKMNGASSWTIGTVPIFWDSATGIPDTILITYNACSSIRKSIPQPGSKLYLDDAAVVGIGEINAPKVGVDIYPNPASTQVNFQVMSQSAITRADIYDITGQKVNSYGIRNNFLTISTQGYASGLYFYQLYDKDGALVKSGKFSIAGK
jgi:hypothetical protein